jgi:uncharacterized protein YhaN
MSTSSSDPTMTRIAALEQRVKELHARIAALERQLNPDVEHPSDAATVRRKVVYDWQDEKPRT